MAERRAPAPLGLRTQEVRVALCSRLRPYYEWAAFDGWTRFDEVVAKAALSSLGSEELLFPYPLRHRSRCFRRHRVAP